MLEFTLALIGLLCAFAIPALAADQQGNPTYTAQAISGPVTLITTTSNLAASQTFTNSIRRGHLGLGVVYNGGDATNTGVVGFRCRVVFGGTNQTTTTPFTLTSTANGTTAVRDWMVVPDYTLGPGDQIILSTVTNAAVNIGGAGVGGATNSITVSNAWFEWRN